jgi:hypothetical protein
MIAVLGRRGLCNLEHLRGATDVTRFDVCYHQNRELIVYVP